MILGDKEEHFEFFNYALLNVLSEMKSDILESNGFDLEKIFANHPKTEVEDKPKSYISTKKKSNERKNPESDPGVSEFVEGYENFLQKLSDAKKPSELNKNRAKELSRLYENEKFDKSIFEQYVFIICKDIFLENKHEFQNKTQITPETRDDIDDEFLSSKDASVFQNGVFNFLSIEKDYDFNLQFKYGYSEDDTGYIIPFYNRIPESVSYSDLIKKYDSAVTDFKLKHNEKVSMPELVNITQFRDLLYNQVKRQFEVIDSLNELAQNYLVSIYRLIELHLLQYNKNENPESYKDDLPNDWMFYLGMVRVIGEFFTDNELDENKLEGFLEKFNEIPVFPAEQKEQFLLLLATIYLKKEPVLRIAKDLLIRIRCLESIIEDMLMGQTLKQPEDFVEWFSSQSEVTKPDQGIKREDIIRTALEKKNSGESVISVFNDMREWLLNEEEGFGEKEFKKKYGFGISDPDSFNRFLNKV